MAFGSRSSELVDWLRCVLGFVVLAAALWWHEPWQVQASIPEISDNKVVSWSSAARVVSHASDLSTSAISTKLPWTKLEEEVACSSSSSNKCVLPPDQIGAARSLLLSSHRGGGKGRGVRFASDLSRSGGWGDVVIADAYRSASSTASRWPQAGPPSTLMAEGRPIPTCTLPSSCCCKVSINLQAMPFRRSFNSGAISSRCNDPSGLVPGAVVVGRRRKYREHGGEGAAGPDGVSSFRSEVLCVNCQDLVVISVFFEILFVLCNSTAQYQ